MDITTVCILKSSMFVLTHSLLTQTVVRFLNLLLDTSVYFLVKSSCSKILAKWGEQELPILKIGSLLSDQLLMFQDPVDDVWSPWPVFSRLMLAQLSQNPLYLWCFLLGIFHPLPPTLILGYKFPPVLAVFEIEPGLILCLFSPIGIVLSKIYCCLLK